jgi:hypothetical protein
VKSWQSAVRTVAGDLIALNSVIWGVQSFRDLKAGACFAGWKPALFSDSDLRRNICEIRVIRGRAPRFGSGYARLGFRPDGVAQDSSPAVSQVFNLQAVRTVAGDLIALNSVIWGIQSFRALKAGACFAGWKPAIQQVENLRYSQKRTLEETSAKSGLSAVERLVLVLATPG